MVRIQKKYILFASALFAIFLLSFMIMSRPDAPTPQPSNAAYHPASHVVRITAKLTFDGKPVEFDDLIHCNANGTRDLEAPYYRAKFGFNRISIVEKTPDGGALTYMFPQILCAAFPEIWFGANSGPNMDHDWIPPLYWLDKADVRQFEEGIYYVSRTALAASNSRLKLVEPFEVSIPEHPPNDDLLARSSRQNQEQTLWPGGPPDTEERVATLSYLMPLALRIPKHKWMDPAFEEEVRPFIPKRLFESTDFAGLREHLSDLRRGDDTIGLDLHEQTSPEIAYTTWMFTTGKRRSIGPVNDRGLPDRNALGYGLLMTNEAAARHAGNPFYPNQMDELIPLKCVDGDVVADLENPGLIYSYPKKNHCWKAAGVDRFKPLGTSVVQDFEDYPRQFFDSKSGDLWIMYSQW